MNIPFVLENTHGNERLYDLYSKLLTDRIIFLEGEIDDRVSSLVISELIYLDSLNNEDISLYINSPGGSITSGLAIIDTMDYIKSNVRTIGIGMCASMAAVILSNGTKGKRHVLKNTEVMIHQPLGGVNGQATEIQIVAEHILKLKEKLYKILSKNTNQTLNKIKKDSDRDYYMDSIESLNYGIIDKII